MAADEELTPIPPATVGKHSGARWAAGVAVAGIALLVGLVGIAQLTDGDGDGRAGEGPAGRAPDRPGGNTAGRSAPAQSFERFDGTAGTLADYRGKPVVVNFWASWCPPCVAEMPDFAAVHQQLGDRVAFLGVNLTDEPAAADALARRTGVSYDLARDADGRLFEAMGGFSMPATFFVSAEGRIVDQHSGQLSRSRLERLIAETVAG